jgi:hypothetical protein
MAAQSIASAVCTDRTPHFAAQITMATWLNSLLSHPLFSLSAPTSLASSPPHRAPSSSQPNLQFHTSINNTPANHQFQIQIPPPLPLHRAAIPQSRDSPTALAQLLDAVSAFTVSTSKPQITATPPSQSQVTRMEKKRIKREKPVSNLH